MISVTGPLVAPAPPHSRLRQHRLYLRAHGFTLDAERFRERINAWGMAIALSDFRFSRRQVEDSLQDLCDGDSPLINRCNHDNGRRIEKKS